MKNIYCTITKDLITVGDFVEETTGWKDVNVYLLKDNKLVLIGELELKNEDDSHKEVEFYLENNSEFTSTDYSINFI